MDVKTWWVTLTEEDRLRTFENRVLRRIFGSKSNKITGVRRKLDKEKLTELCSSPDIIWLVK